jgi:putative transposase
MPASALFRVAARPSLDTGGGSIYVNLSNGLSSARLVCHTRRMNTPPTTQYKHHRFPAEIISHGVWLYFRFCLSYRDVEELLFARGIIVTYEAIRKWCRKFGQSYANQLRRRRPQPGDKWPLDEVFLAIKGQRYYLWRAVDQEGTVLDILVQRRRDKQAAKRFFRKLLKGCQYVPRVIVTDKLGSYGAAKREILPGTEHRQHRYLNNRAENSHQPTRQRERLMQGFKSPGQVQRLLAAYGLITQHFWPRRHFYPHLSTAKKCRNDFTPGTNSRAYGLQHQRRNSGHHAPSCLMIMSACNKLTYMDPPPVSRDGRAATRKRADAGIYPASD